MKCLTVVALALAFALAAAAPRAGAPYDPVAFAEEFINLGAINSDPSTQDCNRYAGLFRSDAILHSPGVPDAYGTDAIVQACENSIALVNPLISFQTLNINVTSWNTEKRTAISWVINGVRTRDQQNVAAPAISCLFQDPQGIIETAWSFYDDNLVSTSMKDDPFNASTIVALYTNLGNLGNEHAVHNCSLWAAQFEADGISQEPGVPPVSGYDDLVALCNRRSTRWSKFIPSVQTILPVMSWNTEKRVAIEWTITGIMTTGKAYVVRAITMLLMSSDFKIQQSWDFWDDIALPVPTGF